ncbi:MAG: FHA domain-containing protein [Myxococcales bacterium]|nr:MAG: FHA domain-containing protein [Myxococcales bacterium]
MIMASITVWKGREVALKAQLKKERMDIGRLESADIVLDNVLVSRRHAVLVAERGAWRIEDVSGKNGVYVNGEQKERHVLRDGDKIEIGKFLLEFRQGQDERERDQAMASKEPGAGFKLSFDEMVSQALGKPDKEDFRKLGRIDDASATMKLPAGQLGALHEEMRLRRQPHLVALTPLPKSVYPLAQKEIVLGRADDADVALPGGITIGRVHAKIGEYGDQWFIEHVSGFAGTKVNGVKVAQKLKLNEGDEIEIGSHKLKFMSSAKNG